MNHRARLIASSVLVALAFIGAAGPASADTTFDSGLVTVMAETRAVRIGVGDLTLVSVDKVSNPGVQVRVTASEGSVPVVATTHPAGTNGCSAADNPTGGTLNRTITVQGGGSASVYVKVQYTRTTVAGISTTTVLEPLGPNGTTVTTVGLVSGLPISVCVA